MTTFVLPQKEQKTRRPSWLAYLNKLDKRMRSEHDTEIQPNMRGGPMKVKYDEFKETHLLSGDLEKILEIVREQGLIMMPDTHCSGFTPGFTVYQPGKKPTGPEVVLMFTEKQLPKGYTFSRLLRTCLAKENVERARQYNLGEISRSRDDYDY
jgi:hypothetical protein